MYRWVLLEVSFYFISSGFHRSSCITAPWCSGAEYFWRIIKSRYYSNPNWIALNTVQYSSKSGGLDLSPSTFGRLFLVRCSMSARSVLSIVWTIVRLFPRYYIYVSYVTHTINGRAPAYLQNILRQPHTASSAGMNRPFDTLADCTRESIERLTVLHTIAPLLM